MSRKRKKSVPTAPQKQEKKLVIDMMKVERAKANHSVGFRTGRHLTEKDRPRKKDWKREYERAKEPGRYRDNSGSGSFNIHFLFLAEREDSNYNKSAKGNWRIGGSIVFGIV